MDSGLVTRAGAVGRRIERVAALALAAAIAVSAAAGGVGLVGGGALAAAALMARGHRLALPVAVAAGLVQVGWIVGEVALVGTHGPVMLWLQVVYFLAGALLAGLAGHLWQPTLVGVLGRPEGRA
jgi:hypothetical protein